MKPITKCIIPAAGFGTRFLPATKAQPKEMLPVVDKPVIQYLVEEAVASGIKDIVIVTGRGKRNIEDHFDMSFELEHTLVEKGKAKELEEVEKISKLANIAYVRQPIPKGDGDAILRAKSFIGDEPFLVLFGDDLIRGDEPGAKQLMDAFYRKNCPIICLEKVSDNRVSSYGIVEPSGSDGRIHRVARFLEKPKPEETTSRLGVVGKYVLTPDIFDYLEKVPSGKDGELRLADAFVAMLKEKDIYGVELKGERYDTGDKFGFLKATIDFALDREDLGPKLLEFLEKRMEKYGSIKKGKKK
ncbi:MAG: UTP--glucose-1-phosphate uridylyltransferase GalU [Candidatus Gracilibacteria bacterium]|nr:UTP--glucose-1-phosphate uridylyltransferase GalU [Candidatus Gracilibacteria bacterium]